MKRGLNIYEKRPSCAKRRDAPSLVSPGTLIESAVLYVDLYIHIRKETYTYMKRGLHIYEKRLSCANRRDTPSSASPGACRGSAVLYVDLYIDVYGKRPTACENIERDRTCGIPQPFDLTSRFSMLQCAAVCCSM